MTERPLLVTSIAPHNVENQQRAIESWLRLGFAVTSLNAASEIVNLKPRVGNNVEFVTVQRDALADCGKPMVYLNDVMAFFASRGTRVCGLINSDIHLRAKPEAIRYLLDEARNSVVLASRTDVNSLDDAAGEVYKFGFDMFLFDTAILEILPSTEFCLGQPWWDYWLASHFINKSPQSAPCKFSLKLVAFPLAVHVKHEKYWDQGGNYEKYGMHFAKCLDPATHATIMKQPPAMLRTALYNLSVNITAMVLLQGKWISYVRE